MAKRSVSITPDVTVGGEQLLVIAGPCQIESREHCLTIGREVQKLCVEFGFNYIFKSSYDKANRTSAGSKRGIGIDEGLKILGDVRKELGVPVLTDVHSADDATIAGEVVDVVQTPAFLCRQTDLLVAAGKTGKAVNVKKGQFLAPEDMRYVAEKIAGTGNENIMLCERGTCFGYRDLVVDMRGLLIMADTGYPVIFDATHSVQQMGGQGGSSGGLRHFIRPLIRGAIAVGVDGVFIECHEAPERAPSDGASMLPLGEMRATLEEIKRMRDARRMEPSR